MNIWEYKRDGVVVGYTVARREKGHSYRKRFARQDVPLEENYRKALECLEQIKSGVFEDNKYNRSQKLPKNICFYKNKKGEVKG